MSTTHTVTATNATKGALRAARLLCGAGWLFADVLSANDDFGSLTSIGVDARLGLRHAHVLDALDSEVCRVLFTNNFNGVTVTLALDIQPDAENIDEAIQDACWFNTPNLGPYSRLDDEELGEWLTFIDTTEELIF